MENVNKEYLTNNSHWESFVLRALFMIVLACHIPFIFFSGKEALLIIIDEYQRQSISKSLDKRIAHNVDRKFHPIDPNMAPQTNNTFETEGLDEKTVEDIDQ